MYLLSPYVSCLKASSSRLKLSDTKKRMNYILKSIENLLPSAPVISSTYVEKIGSYNTGLLFPSCGGGGASVLINKIILLMCFLKWLHS